MQPRDLIAEAEATEQVARQLSLKSAQDALRAQARALRRQAMQELRSWAAEKSDRRESPSHERSS